MHGILDVTFYRDDFSSNWGSPKVGPSNISFDVNNITIIFANGDVRIKKKFFQPKIGEGATIIVHFKEEEDPFSFNQFATGLSSIITSMATIYLLVK